MTNDAVTNDRGQILLEVIIAAAIIGIVASGIVGLLTVSSRGIKQAREKTAAAFLFQETSEAVRATAREDWFNIANLATGSPNFYHATTSAGKWVIATGTEAVVLNDISYARSFWVDDVFRSQTDGNIVESNGYPDPSTKKVTVRLTWTSPAIAGDHSFEQFFYLSRFFNEIYDQTDWTGGAVGEQTTSGATTTFATSTNIDHESATGSIKLQTQ